MRYTSRTFLTILMLSMSHYAQSWHTQITDSLEPGQPLVVSGHILKINDDTPVAGAKVHVYQTDSTGYYGPNQTNDGTHRLNGDLVTDKDGKYQYYTIMPGKYPNNRIPAHIHYIVNLPDGSEQKFELLFEGDRSISERTKKRAKRKGDFFYIATVEEVDGVLQAKYNVYVD